MWAGALKTGAGFALGGKFTKSGFRFLGGKAGRTEAFELGLEGGYGFIGAGKAAGWLRIASKVAGPLLGLGFTAHSAYEGFKEDGILGAHVGIAKEIAIMTAFDALAAGGAKGLGGAGVRATKFLGTRLIPPVLAGVVAAGAMKSAWMHHVNSLPLETTGSMEAFHTRAAATMRQRSVMNIERSHLNARSAFGSEAAFMHISSYRGGPR